MTMKSRTSWFVVLVLLVAAVALSLAADDAKEPGRVMIGIYRVAPGKHLEFLKWQAAQDAVAREAGIPVAQWYAHADGDSWDYIAIGPDTTKEQNAKLDELMKKKGLKIGFAASLEFRQFVASHTDTKALGPLTAADFVKMAEQ